jgi:hypothetical protein
LDDGTMGTLRDLSQTERDKHVLDELIAQLKTQIAGGLTRPPAWYL